MAGQPHRVPAVRVVAHRKDQPRRARQDRFEQPLAGQDGCAIEPGARRGARVGAHVQLRDAPQERCRLQPGRQRRTERAVEHDRCVARDPRVAGRRPRERERERQPAEACGTTQGRVVTLGKLAHRLDQPRVDLRLGERAGCRREQRLAQVERVARELEVEVGRLGLLELAAGRQHVVRLARGLGHRHVDHDDQLEGSQRLAHALAVGERVHRIGALDQHRAVAIRMVGEDLLGNHVARDEPDDDLRADDRAAPLHRPGGSGGLRRALPLAQLGERQERHECVVGALAAEVPGEQPDQALQVAVQRGVHVHLHAEVFEHRDALRARDPARDPAQQVFVHAADRGVSRDVDRAQRRLDLRRNPSCARRPSPSRPGLPGR